MPKLVQFSLFISTLGVFFVSANVHRKLLNYEIKTNYYFFYFDKNSTNCSLHTLSFCVLLKTNKIKTVFESGSLSLKRKIALSTFAWRYVVTTRVCVSVLVKINLISAEVWGSVLVKNKSKIINNIRVCVSYCSTVFLNSNRINMYRVFFCKGENVHSNRRSNNQKKYNRY